MFTFQEFYTHKINDLKLEEALEIHYQLNPQFTRWNLYPTDLQRQTMKSHDIMHVIFGCNTSLAGEFRVELLTFFCVNLTLKQYSDLVSNNEISKEPFEIVKQIGYWKVFWVMLSHVCYVPYCFYISKKMNKKWPVLETDKYMGKTIGEIRAEYRIEILNY